MDRGFGGASCPSPAVPWAVESKLETSESPRYSQPGSYEYPCDELGSRRGSLAQMILDHEPLVHKHRDLGDHGSRYKACDGIQGRNIAQNHTRARAESPAHYPPVDYRRECLGRRSSYENDRLQLDDQTLQHLGPSLVNYNPDHPPDIRGQFDDFSSASGSNPNPEMLNTFSVNKPKNFVTMTESNERTQLDQPRSFERSTHMSPFATADGGRSLKGNVPLGGIDSRQFSDPTAHTRASYSQRKHYLDESCPRKRQRIDPVKGNVPYRSIYQNPYDMITSMPHIAAAQTLISMHECSGGTQRLESQGMTPIALLAVPELTPPGSTNRSVSFSPGPRTPLDEKLFPEQKQLPSPIPTPKLIVNQSKVDDINLEQQNLLRDPRVIKQLDWFKRVRDTQPPTHYSGLAPIGIHIMEAGNAAQTSDLVENADYLVGDSKKLEDWLIHGTGDKLFVLRDPDWLHTRPQTYSSTMLKDLRTTSGKSLEIEVQLLEKVHVEGENSVTSMSIDSIIERFADQSQTLPPINLLSLMCADDGTVPWPLAKHCNLLNQAAAFSASTAHANFIAERTATAGKQSNEIMSRYVDLQACIHFQIFGQAGAISSWHIDSIGPYTHITLEPSAAGAPASDVLKLWAYIRTDHLSADEQAQIRKDFIAQGGGYKPDPKLIRILSLVAGDTLIMPPGTIHSPITITDCLFRGGMVMQKKFMKRSVQEWRFCSDHGDCTNEEQPKQARSVLDYFRLQVLADPESCGYNPSSIPEFLDSWKAISSACMKCNCKSGCHKDSRCGCMRNSQRCGGHCHKKDTKCLNPHGCEADVMSESKTEPKTDIKAEAKVDVLVES